MIRHGDYPTAWNPWDMPHRGRKDAIGHEQENSIVNKCYVYYEATRDYFVKDQDHPYIQEKTFDWIRGYQVGGKSLLGLVRTRWSDYEFKSPARDGYALIGKSIQRPGTGIPMLKKIHRYFVGIGMVLTICRIAKFYQVLIELCRESNQKSIHDRYHMQESNHWAMCSSYRTKEFIYGPRPLSKEDIM